MEKGFSSWFVCFLENLEFHHMTLSSNLIFSQWLPLLPPLAGSFLLRKQEGLACTQPIPDHRYLLFPCWLINLMPFPPFFSHLNDLSSFFIIQVSHRCFSNHSSGCKISSAHQAGNTVRHQHCAFLQNVGIIVKEQQTFKRVPTKIWEKWESPLSAIFVQTRSRTFAALMLLPRGLVSLTARERMWFPVRQTAHVQRPWASPLCAVLVYLPPCRCV